jgi:hypothetical protein
LITIQTSSGLIALNHQSAEAAFLQIAANPFDVQAHAFYGAGCPEEFTRQPKESRRSSR